MKDWNKSEATRYDTLYKNKKKYGASDFSQYSKFFPEIINPRLVTLDLGCGAGHLSNKYMNYTGVDISREIIVRNRKILRGTFYLGALDNLERWYGWRYDQVHCNDVMEHVPVEMVGLVLKEISKLTSKAFYFKIHKGESNYADDQGNLHRTVRDHQWWHDIISNWFVVTEEFYKGKGMDEGYLSYFKCVKK